MIPEAQASEVRESEGRRGGSSHGDVSSRWTPLGSWGFSLWLPRSPATGATDLSTEGWKTRPHPLLPAQGCPAPGRSSSCVLSAGWAPSGIPGGTSALRGREGEAGD